MAKSSAVKQVVRKSVRPKRSGQIPVTSKMLQKTRSELKSSITTLRLETRAGFKKVDARFNDMEARFNDIDARFSGVDARFSSHDARFDRLEAMIVQLASQMSGLQAAIHRVEVLVEEQNARNIYVLDGYTSLDARLKVLEG